MKKFYIATLGCKVNQYESDGIASELTAGKWQKSDNAEDADICIINTCTVTSKAAMQSRQKIRSIIKSNPKSKIIVTGCHAQTALDEIRKIENIDIIADNQSKFKIASTILKLEDLSDIGRKQNSSETKQEHNLPEVEQEDLKQQNYFYTFKPAVTGSMTRAYLKIQDGCNAFCTYCIVPYARGRSRSMPINDVLEHLWHLSSKGYKEAVLTGIHLGAYGLDFQNGASITKLLKEIERIRPIHRIRLSSIEPTELTDEIINSASKLSALSASNKITNSASKSEKSILCDHFHIPLQSGDDSVLERMGRPYNSKFFSDLIMKIHNAVPTAAIGVDVLEGFPGESEKEFENTLNLITKLPISYLHVFPFSPRKGTPAFRFPDKVKAGTVKERCAIIRYIGFNKRKNFEESLIGKSFESVIQDKRDESTGKLIAVTSNYLSLLVDGDDKLKRQIVQTTFETIEKRGALIGKIL